MVNGVNDCYDVLPHHHYCWYEDNSIYLVEVNTGDIYLLKFSNERNILSYLVTVPSHIYKKYKYRVCIHYDDNIYLFPEDGDIILVYNIKVEGWKYIEVENIESPTNPYIYNGMIVLFVYKYHKINFFCLDTHTHRYEFFDLNIHDEDRIINEMVINDDVIYFASAIKERIYLYNRTCQSIKKISFADIHTGWSTICKVHDDLWLSNWEGGIYKYNITSRKFLKYEVEIDIHPRIMKKAPAFFNCVYVGGNIYFIPGSSKEIICIKSETLKSFKLVINDIIGTDKQEIYTRYWLSYIRMGRYVGVYDFSEQKIWEIDTISNSISIRKYMMDMESLKMKKSIPMYEGLKFDKQLYEICIKNNSANNMIFPKDTIGNHIYQTVFLHKL